jgi:hypothetical protein
MESIRIRLELFVECIGKTIKYIHNFGWKCGKEETTLKKCVDMG